MKSGKDDDDNGDPTSYSTAIKKLRYDKPM